MIMVPTWVADLIRAGRRVSEWIDQNIFPVKGDSKYGGADVERAAKQASAESDANVIRRTIAGCKLLEHTYHIHGMIIRYEKKHGSTVQVKAAVASLRLDLMNKQSAIIEKL
jgi:hypothetical protein